MARAPSKPTTTIWRERLRSAAQSALDSPFTPTSLEPAAKRLARRRRRSEGVPSSVEFETLEQVCLETWGRPLRRVWHTSLLSWKGESVAFVWLRMEGGLTKRVVVKTARYEKEVFPASIDAPGVAPGLPELWVYGRAAHAMRAFIPRVFLAIEQEPGRFVYVLEDLTGGYGQQRGRLDWRDGINGMFSMHEALAGAVASYGGEQLFRYDAAFSQTLLLYANRAVVAFDGASDGSIRDRLLQAWPGLEETYLGDEPELPNGGVPIHGDYDPRNVFIHRRDRDRVKAIDWEWAGFGWPHADLASYLKSVSPEVVSWALDQIAKRDENLSPREHERLFLRARLERAIRGSTLLATQYTADRRRFGYLGPTVNEALSRSLESLDRLRSR